MSEYCKKLNPTLLAACSWDEALDLAGGVPRSWSMTADALKASIDDAALAFTSLRAEDVFLTSGQRKKCIGCYAAQQKSGGVSVCRVCV